MFIAVKPFALKLLYFIAGSPALFLLALISKKDLAGSPENFLLFALLGGFLVGGVLVQKKIWETGIMKTSKGTTFAALLIVAAVALLLIRKIII